MKRLSRRTVLKGVGATIALPWLEAMAPAKSLLPKNWNASPAFSAPKRMAFMYIPNGVIGEKWFPEAKEHDFSLPPSLQPLDSLREQLTIISGLNRTYIGGEPHSQAASCWMTSALPTQFEDGQTAINTTLDQIIAQHAGNATPFRSLELSCNSFTDNMEPKIFDAISWYGAGNDARAENNPRRVFERLFGKAKHIEKGVLDTVLSQAKDLRSDLGQNDRRKLDEYLESVRSIETRLEKQATKLKTMKPVDMKKPEKIPTNRGE